MSNNEMQYLVKWYKCPNIGKIDIAIQDLNNNEIVKFNDDLKHIMFDHYNVTETNTVFVQVRYLNQLNRIENSLIG